MPNPYTEAYAPQMLPSQQYQPTVQDIQSQKMLQNKMLQQQQMMQPSAQQQNPMSKNMALASMLRDSQQPTNAVSPWDNAKAWWNSNFNRDESVM